MTRRMKIMIAAGIGLAALAGGTAYALAFQGGDAAAAQLRATGLVGEQADGYMGLVGSASADVRAQVDAVNIQRRAAYTRLASERGATVQEVAAATACQIFAARIGPGQYYRLPDGVWRQRDSAPIPLPAYCG